MTGEYILGCITIVATTLGSVALLARARKREPDPVVDLKLDHGEKTMNGLEDDLAQLEEHLERLSKEMGESLARLSKEIAEVHHNLNNLRIHVDGLAKAIDEMPARFARIVKALG